MTSTPSSTPTPTADASFASCTTAIPSKYGYVPPTACNSNFNFSPSFPAAVAVSIIFGLLTATHLTEALLFKKRYAWVLITGALWETLAFITGALGAHDQQNAGYATPLWVNAFVYMTFARMVRFFLPDGRVGVFRAAGMSKWFVWADVLSFAVQAAGGVMTSPGGAGGTVQIGLHIYTGGVAMQELFIFCFLGLMVVFHRKAFRLDDDERCMGSEEGRMPRGWKALLYTLYAVPVFISVSS